MKKEKKPWPTKKAMEQVYDMNLWGGEKGRFYSGEGSHNPKIIQPYIAAICSFLDSFEMPINVCDLGCGDFNVGKELFPHAKKYIGVDIVEELIDFNKERFKEENLEFCCLDIAKDNLPEGECVLIRQVLQHLSNKEIESVIKKLPAYRYIILTEHLPEGDFIPNKDIISGQGIRLKKNSGVNLLTPPFNFKIKEERELLSIPLEKGKGIIVTTLYKMFD